MRFDIAFKHYAALSGAGLVSFSSVISDASARLVSSSDIRENIKKSTSFTKVEGEECIKLQEDIVSNKKDIEYVDVGILGCGDALVCLEDASSSTGARCVDFKETFVKDKCVPAGHIGCVTDMDCCENETCSPIVADLTRQKCSIGGVFCGIYFDPCEVCKYKYCVYIYFLDEI